MTDKDITHLAELTDAHTARADAWAEVKADPNVGLDNLTAASERVAAAEQAHADDLTEWRQGR